MELIGETRDAIARLVCAIILQAIHDWELLDYGMIKRLKSTSYYIYRKEVYDFLISDEFKAMMHFVCPGVSMTKVKEILHLYGDY